MQHDMQEVKELISVRKDEEIELLIPGMLPQESQEVLHMDESSILKHCTSGTWSCGHGSSFLVRQGPNYVSTRIKAPSRNSMFKIFAFDAWQTKERKIKNIAQYYKMPSRPVPEKFYIPPVLIINVMVPNYDTYLFGANQTDGKGWSMVFFGELSESTRDLIRQEKITPSMKLYQKFVQGVKHGEFVDRLKVIAKILNPSEACSILGPVVGLLVSQYNGTPFLARTSTTFYHVEGEYFGIDVDVHLFGKIARNGLSGVRQYISDIVYDMAFVIEGRGDEENPEQVLASIRVSKIGSGKARPFPYEARIKE